MQVELSPEAEALVKEVVAQSAGTLTVSDIVNQAILSRLALSEEEWAAIDALCDEAEASADAGRTRVVDDAFMAELRARVRARREDRQRRPA